jgi:hypothetical protein
VRLENRDLLHDVGDHCGRQAVGADEDQGLRGEVDVLFVFKVVDGDGLVAELAQLDTDLVRGRLARTGPDDRPVTPGQANFAASSSM